MMYPCNNQLRSTMLIDGTAEARLADIFAIMDRETFGQRKAAALVGGLSRLVRLIEDDKIRSDKPTNKQNGKWYCNAADVLKYAVIKHKQPRKTNKNEKANSKRIVA